MDDVVLRQIDKFDNCGNNIGGVPSGSAMEEIGKYVFSIIAPFKEIPLESFSVSLNSERHDVFYHFGNAGQNYRLNSIEFVDKESKCES